MSEFLEKTRSAFDHFAKDVDHAGHQLSDALQREKHSHTSSHACHMLHDTIHNRYYSFAPPRTQNNVKYYVDGCSYFWAVSVAIEKAKSEIWIMDWWLSPELYLRRTPSNNEGYRLDSMLKAAAERGVKINVMIYKEVTEVLTLNSEHTKHSLEALHSNIAVFRHPDHNPSARVLESEIISGIKNFHFSHKSLAELSHEGLEALYGLNDDVILYWAHHEKLCLVDGDSPNAMAFCGGLDLCFGRWDTHQHQIADAHPVELNDEIWPGQDYNNARIMDFEDVTHYDRNKLDRTKDARMGWSDLSVSLEGPIIEDMKAHFVHRWNWIYRNKYASVRDMRYQPLTMGTESPYYHPDGSNRITGTASQQLSGNHANAPVPADIPQPPGAFLDESHEPAHHHFHTKSQDFLHRIHERFHNSPQDVEKIVKGGMDVQMVRSASRWSNGTRTEHSIANAYIDLIGQAQSFIYIENQFFITATNHSQHPVMNRLGAAIVDRITKAYQSQQNFKVIVCMPSVPGFAGDLHSSGAAGTLAIMNFQFRSINRGTHSILQSLKLNGIERPEDYITFYNLRNYDRINASGAMAKVERESGVSYESARKEHDDLVGAGFDGIGEGTGAIRGQTNKLYEGYEKMTPADNHRTTVDSVSACYMLNGPPLSSMTWDAGSNIPEIDCFVSEELYIHTKMLIIDDNIALIGSANLNDRSQLGTHDSEIAVVIKDEAKVDSVLDGKPSTASRFAASLRRTLFRKHLGLLGPQDFTKADNSFMPVGYGAIEYDWGSKEDLAVQDVLSQSFQDLWKSTATNNTRIFQRTFAPVPSNAVKSWNDYTTKYAKLFVSASPPGTKVEDMLPSRYRYGHVVRENFPGGVEEMKEYLGGVRGTLVDMQLDFLCDIKDLVKEGLGYNVLTEEIYT